MSSLRDLDDRVLPRAAARLRAGLRSARSGRTGVGEWARSLLAPSDRPGVLRRLDDRYASSGPLGLVRDVPQVGLAVVAAVFLAGSGVALARGGDDPDRGSAASPEALAPVLGPDVGDTVSAYVAATVERATAASRARPDGVHVALVSLSAYRTPADVATLFDGVDVLRAYVRVPSRDPSEILSADVEDLRGDLGALYAATAERKAQDEGEFIKLAATIDATNDEQQRFKEFYELSGRLAGREAAAYRDGCACVFSLVVRDTAAVLAALPALQGVRAVELGPRGAALAELRVRPLGPEQVATVTAAADPRPGRTR